MDSEHFGNTSNIYSNEYNCDAPHSYQFTSDKPVVGKGVTRIDQRSTKKSKVGSDNEMNRKKRKLQKNTAGELPEDTIIPSQNVEYIPNYEERKLDGSFYEYIPGGKSEKVKTSCAQSNPGQWRYVPTKIKNRPKTAEKVKIKNINSNVEPYDIYHPEYFPTRSNETTKADRLSFPNNVDVTKYEYIPTKLSHKPNLPEKVQSGNKPSNVEEYDIHHPEYFPNKSQRPTNYSYKFGSDNTGDNCESSSRDLKKPEYVPSVYVLSSIPDEKVEQRFTSKMLRFHHQDTQHQLDLGEARDLCNVKYVPTVFMPSSKPDEKVNQMYTSKMLRFQHHDSQYQLQDKRLLLKKALREPRELSNTEYVPSVNKRKVISMDDYFRRNK